MTGTQLLAHLGLPRAPGTSRTRANRAGIAVIAAVLATVFFTRNLDLLTQVSVVAAVSIVVGVAGPSLRSRSR